MKCAYCGKPSKIVCCECGRYACGSHTRLLGRRRGTALVCYKCAKRLN